MSARFVDEREIVRNKSSDFSTEKVVHALSPHYSIRSLPSFVHYISNCRVTNFRNRIERDNSKRSTANRRMVSFVTHLRLSLVTKI